MANSAAGNGAWRLAIIWSVAAAVFVSAPTVFLFRFERRR